MKWPIIAHAKRCTKIFWLLAFAGSTAQADWGVDFSRRQSKARPAEVTISDRAPARAEINKNITKVLKPLLPDVASTQPEQEVVILNTDKGFVPKNLRLHQGRRYLIHVANINAGEKNVSFMLDAFSENHATYFGQVKTFVLNADKDGVFNFQCPETAAQGQMVVMPSAEPSPARLPAATPSSTAPVEIVPILPEH